MRVRRSITPAEVVKGVMGPGEPVAELFARAEQGLYESKRRGKNRLTWADDLTPAQAAAP